ncbi:MAG: ribonuclease III [Bacilli bacterium]|nr:ribonuclease III [Bacilli bacterium]MBR2997775.1 ribonuclease III [Bacilli bacterium]
MDIFSRYGIDLNNELVKRAFTHSSYVNEAKEGEDYERLEFLGDKILDFIVSEYLYVNDDYDEGKMTKLRSSYVCENALYTYAKSLDFPKYLRLGKGEELTGGREKPSIIADTFESFLAAVYMTKDFETVRNIVYDVVIPYIENEEDLFLHDYKTKLQEIVQTDQKSTSYELINEEGPANNKTFTVVVKIDGVVLGKGTANSKKEAEQEAAKDALSKLTI